MEKTLVKEFVGEFIKEFYAKNVGKNVEVCLDAKSEKIQIYYKDRGTFDYVTLIDKNPTVESLVQSLSI